MKRSRIWITLLLLICSFGLQAGVRTVEEAMAIAGRFMAESKKGIQPAEITQRAMAASLDEEPMQLAYTQMQYDNSQAALYVFTHSEEGFVIVSADDRTRTILGYADGAFSEEEMPANMRAWMQMYADEIARLPKAGTAPSLDSDEAFYPTVEPLLGSTIWNQSAPYNNHCPIDPSTNERSVTGCMATATAQVMYHHKHPVSGVGSHSYRWRGQTLSVDFSQAVYDWEHMLPAYREGQYTQVESDAVAELMYHVGVSCNMSYGSSASGAGMGSSMRALVDYFDYDPAIRVLKKDFMDEDMILAEIAEDLLASRPIHIEALTKRGEGHAFVCDGMQANGYIHINWGWGGYADGYFALSVMNPTNQGIGGASDDGAFTESVTLYLDVQPNQGGVSVPVLLATSMEMKSKPALAMNEKIVFELGSFQNGGMAQEDGHIAMLIYKDSALHKTIKTGFYFDLKPHYYYSTPFNVNATMSGIEEGQYELVVGVDMEDKEDQPIYVQPYGLKRYTMTVKNDSIFLKEIVKVNKYYGHEFATMQVTDLSAKTGSNNLRIVLQTVDFAVNNKGKVTSGYALSLDLFPSTVTSVVGSYGLDAANTKAYGTLSSTYSQYMGIDGSKQISEKFTEGVVSVSQILGGHYVIDYHLKNSNIQLDGRCKIGDLYVKCYRQTPTGSVSTYTLANDMATAMDVKYAYNWLSQLNDSALQDVPFYVQGMVSQIETIATEAGTATFSISTDGAAANAVRCDQAMWMNNTSFVTGNEIAVKDTVTLVGYMQHVDYTTPTLYGYVYDYRQYVPNPNTAIGNVEGAGMGVAVEGMSMTITSAYARDTYVYDVMGRVVAYQPMALQCRMEVPVAGCYIVRCGDEVRKIIIE